MSPGEIPNERGLRADIARVEPLLMVPFGRFLDEKSLRKLDDSKNRSILASVMRRHFVELDWRIRFVKAASDENPDATMKLSSVEKAIRVAKGWRLLRLLDGGVVAATVRKKGPPEEWRIVALKHFMPAGQELERHENDIESLLRLYLRSQNGKAFPATTIGAFQIRTGPAIHDLYLKAHDYFAGLDGAK
jgi:hypothetical protein